MDNSGAFCGHCGSPLGKSTPDQQTPFDTPSAEPTMWGSYLRSQRRADKFFGPLFRGFTKFCLWSFAIIVIGGLVLTMILFGLGVIG